MKPPFPKTNAPPLPSAADIQSMRMLLSEFYARAGSTMHEAELRRVCTWFTELAEEDNQ